MGRMNNSLRPCIQNIPDDRNQFFFPLERLCRNVEDPVNIIRNL
jgi:hypothetical protein